jgi:hypothetical protein
MFILDPGSPEDPAPWMFISRQVPSIAPFFLFTSNVADPGCLSRTPINQTTTKKKRRRKKFLARNFAKFKIIFYF